MNRTTRAGVTVVLASVLTASSLMAHEPEGAIRRAIIGEVARLAAQSTSSGDFAWGRVRALSPGKSLIIKTVGPGTRKGALVSADASTLRVDIRGQVETIDRDDVLSVTIAPFGLGGHRLASAALGALGGGFAGYAIGYDYPRGEKGIYRAYYVGMPIGIAVGAAAGAFAGGRPAETVYVTHRVSAP